MRISLRVPVSSTCQLSWSRLLLRQSLLGTGTQRSARQYLDNGHANLLSQLRWPLQNAQWLKQCRSQSTSPKGNTGPGKVSKENASESEQVAEIKSDEHTALQHLQLGQPKKKSLMAWFVNANTKMTDALVGPETSREFTERSDAGQRHVILYELGPRQQWGWRKVFMIVPFISVYLVGSFFFNAFRPYEKQEEMFQIKWTDGSLLERAWTANVVLVCIAWSLAAVLSLRIPKRQVEYDCQTRQCIFRFGLGRSIVFKEPKPRVLAPRDISVLSKPPVYRPSLRERVARMNINVDGSTRMALLDYNGKFSKIFLQLYPDRSIEWRDEHPPHQSYPKQIWDRYTKYELRPMRGFGDLLFFISPNERSVTLQKLLNQSETSDRSARHEAARGLDKPAVQRKVEDLLKRRRRKAPKMSDQ